MNDGVSKKKIYIYIKTVDSDETNLGLSIVYGKPPFSRPERE